MRNNRIKRILSIWIILLMTISCSTVSLANEDESTSELIFTFEQGQIVVNNLGDGYKIKGTTLTIKKSGTYRVTGNCTEGNIVVDKGLTDVNLVLDDLNLSCSTTTPLLCKKSTEASLYVSGSVTLTDAEDPANEYSSNAEVADAFEGAAIKAKSDCSLHIEGNGTLFVDGSACKNGIKAGESSTVSFAMRQNGGITVRAKNDGIAADCINVLFGKMSIYSSGDAIQADSALTILDGNIDIKTMDGYDTTGFDSDLSSAKGLKSDGDIDIFGGTFCLNTADDAIHSDDTIRITGGSFVIDSGDDGIHADNYLLLGATKGLERDPMISISNCYEGLESSRVAVFGGKYSINATDDGINASGAKDDLITDNHSISIYGGCFFVQAGSDGMDSNGTLDILGGEIEIWAASHGVENPLDYDTKLTVRNAQVFAAGCQGMNLAKPSGNSQGYKNYSKTIRNGQIVCVNTNDQIVYNTTAVKDASIVFYSNPDMTSKSSLDSCDEMNCEKGNSFAHQWASEVTFPATETTNGVMTYTCSVCGKTERQTIPMTEPSLPAPEEGYKVELSADAHSDILVYRKASEEEQGTLEAIAPKGGKATVFCNDNDEVHLFMVEVRVDSTYELNKVSLAEETADLTLDTVNVESNSYTYKLSEVKADTQVSVKTETENGIPSGNDGGSPGGGPSGPGGEPGGSLSEGEVIDSGDVPPDDPDITPPGEKTEFEDVSDDAYFYDPVKWAVEKDITNGIDETHFGPDQSCTRAQMVSFLWRAAGSPEPGSTDNPFTDVKAGSYYEKAVLWAVEKGITTGISETTFSPNDTVTRGQSVTFLYRFIGEKTEGTTDFTDVEEDAYYYDAVLWAAENGVTTGKTETSFAPEDDCVRAQIVTFLYRSMSE